MICVFSFFSRMDHNECFFHEQHRLRSLRLVQGYVQSIYFAQGVLVAGENGIP